MRHYSQCNVHTTECLHNAFIDSFQLIAHDDCHLTKQLLVDVIHHDFFHLQRMIPGIHIPRIGLH
jgi:hypothetical protein